jgi:hypothetical protein
MFPLATIENVITLNGALNFVEAYNVARLSEPGG